MGSTPAMEAEGVLRIWQRSVSSLGLRYTSVINDGNSETFATLCNKRPYGDSQIIKHECVGHVQKCVGQYLCELKKDKSLKDEEGQCPRFARCLTDANIDKLQ